MTYQEWIELGNPSHAFILRRKENKKAILNGYWEDLSRFLDKLLRLNPTTLKRREFEIIPIQQHLDEINLIKEKEYE